MCSNQNEFAIRCALDSLTGTSSGEQWMALLALRTVAFHLDLAELHTEIDLRLKEVAKAIDMAVNQNEPSVSEPASALVTSHRRKVRHAKTGRYKFLMDHEVRKFMRGYDWADLEFMTIDNLRKVLFKHFGKERTPSRSALGRYLRALREESLCS